MTDWRGNRVDKTSGPGTCSRSAGAALIAGAAILAILPAPVAADEPAGQPDAVTLQVENDLFGSGSDSHYTQGMRISWLPSPKTVPDWMREAALLVPGIDTKDHLTFVFGLGQNMYTPEDISRSSPDPTDRPYAGWLYATFGVAVEDAQRNLLHNVALDLGVVGPLSLAGPTQKVWHKLIDSPEPRGWSHQLDNEPGIILTYEARMRQSIAATVSGFELDVTPKAGVALGNIFTYGAVGASLRFGHNLDLDYGPPFIRPSLPGAGLVKRRDEWGWYAFAGVEGRAVARNIFLDGNTFSDSPSVDSLPFIGDLQFGIVATYNRVRISFTQIFRTKEFETQREGDHYGSLAFTYLF
ncbi:MAG: lipid A deacylase LpxR family protein [Rhodospirillales bacterium]|nr:lipid A deacylase LpxR family protein [Rhodospirillales bacterium]